MKEEEEEKSEKKTRNMCAFVIASSLSMHPFGELSAHDESSMWLFFSFFLARFIANEMSLSKNEYVRKTAYMSHMYLFV